MRRPQEFARDCISPQEMASPNREPARARDVRVVEGGATAHAANARGCGREGERERRENKERFVGVVCALLEKLEQEAVR